VIVSYADPTTGRVTATPHRGWIAHELFGSDTRLLIPCQLHGRLHQVPDLYFSSTQTSTSYAVTAEEWGSVLLAAISPTCRTWTSAKQAFERRLRFTWNSPVQNLILTGRALGTPARFGAMLAAAATISVPTRPLVALRDNICRLKCGTHGWESVAHLYPVTADSLEPLAHIVAQLGIVLAARTFTTCEQVALSYEHLLTEIGSPPGVADWDDLGTAQDAYLHAARVLHRFLSDPIAYATTRSLDALPA
jgi:hypothetical protein